MQEFQIYGPDGIFHSIAKASKIVNGRYAVLPHGSSDLNMNNVLSGIEFPKSKYPGIFCLTPTSTFNQPSVKGQWEDFNFTLLFVTTTYNSGDNKLKKPDPATNSSLHTSPQDWNDMHQVMLGFMTKLEEVAKERPLRFTFRLFQKGTWVIGRFSNRGNDNVSGVYIRFTASMPAICEVSESWEAVTLPNFATNNHPEHLH